MKKGSVGIAILVFILGFVFGAVLWVPVTSKIVRHNLKQEMWQPTQRFNFGHVTVGYSVDRDVSNKWNSAVSDLVHCFTLESGKALSLALAYDDLQQIEGLRRRIIDNPKDMLSLSSSRGD